jgi:hypothetical protein
MSRLLLTCVAMLALAACTESPQTLGGGRNDAPAYAGTGMPYAAKSWKQGDKTSWEQQLRARGQNTQNEYAKTN